MHIRFYKIVYFSLWFRNFLYPKKNWCEENLWQQLKIIKTRYGFIVSKLLSNKYFSLS